MLMLILILLIFGAPFFVALGHDLWLMYEKTGGFDWNQFVFSDLGWLWVTYHEKSYNRAHKTWDDDFWTSYVDPVLYMDAVVVGAALSLLLYLIVIPLHLGGSRKSDRHSLYDKKDDFSFKSVRDDMDKGRL